MRKRMIPLALVAMLALAVGGYSIAGGGKKKVKADLSAYSEVPALSEPGIGSFKATIDDDTQTISYELTYAGLTSGPLFAHIHLGQKDVTGGVSAFLCGGSTKPACPPGPATVTGTIMPVDIVGPTGQGISAGEWAELVAAIRSGNAYANAHTALHPGGEIRGQINDEHGRD